MTEHLSTPAEEHGGCLSSGLLIVLTVWVVIATGVAQAITWGLEQQLFEGSIKLADLRWAVSLGYALAVLLPAGLLWLGLGRHPHRRYFAALALAGGLALLLVPARLAGITAMQAALVLLCAGLGVFIGLFWLAGRRRAGAETGGTAGADWTGLGWGLLAAGALSIPWVLWGALGSLEDTALALLTGLLFGAAAERVGRVVFRRAPDRPAGRAARLLDGLLMALALLVMAAGLGVNGSQGLLTLTVPALGWVMAALYDRLRPAGLALTVGLAAFWPLAFVDPDELAAVISLGQGELIQWANLAALVGLLIGLAVGLGLAAAWAAARRARRAVSLGAAGVVWLAAVGLYVGLGQPGLFGERLFVILKDQADTGLVAQAAAQAYPGDYNARRGAVYAALVKHADTTQAPLREALDRLRIPYQPYYLENGLEVQGGPLVRWWLAARPEVDRVLADPILRPLPEPVPAARGSEPPPAGPGWNLKLIGADRVWADFRITGQGIVVGQSDSGVDGTHPELAANYRGKNGDNTYNWFDPWNHTAAPADTGGHGTHTLATAVGKTVGVAPGAQWIGCVNLARNLGNPAFYLDCMQFNFAPFPPGGDPLRDGRPDLGAMVLNNSWGCPPVEGCDPTALEPAVQALTAAGVFVVASAGNEGQGGCETVADPPALYAQVYSVGSIDGAGALSSFSSTGPVTADGSGRIKPDIAAPGEDVLSAFPGGTYASLSGTSMAGPHVVGVVALMWSANPALIGDIERTRQILNDTAAPYTGPLPTCAAPGRPNDAVGYGVVDAYKAVQAAMLGQ